MKRCQEARFVAGAAAMAFALAGAHWAFSALLLLNWIPAERFRGWVAVCYLANAATFGLGVSLDLVTLAILGGLIPAVATLLIRFVLPSWGGLPTQGLIRDPYFGLTPKDRAGRIPFFSRRDRASFILLLRHVLRPLSSP
jgi:hypothetical protein